MTKETNYCPLMSVGSEYEKVCALENCMWYIPNVKKCSMYMLAYNAMQETNARQRANQPK
ncbi:MAG: hypothetical protein R3Y28_00170 [Candidatus Gastranaerophilales bacterium]